MFLYGKILFSNPSVMGKHILHVIFRHVIQIPAVGSLNTVRSNRRLLFTSIFFPTIVSTCSPGSLDPGLITYIFYLPIFVGSEMGHTYLYIHLYIHLLCNLPTDTGNTELSQLVSQQLCTAAQSAPYQSALSIYPAAQSIKS